MILFLTSLVEQQEEKDRITFIYNKYLKLYTKIANEMLNNSQDVDDIVYDVFLKIIENKDEVFK
jgi:DNA-directed RNA polymerase specialized sigma24 family protein